MFPPTHYHSPRAASLPLSVTALRWLPTACTSSHSLFSLLVHLVPSPVSSARFSSCGRLYARLSSVYCTSDLQRRRLHYSWPLCLLGLPQLHDGDPLCRGTIPRRPPLRCRPQFPPLCSIAVVPAQWTSARVDQRDPGLLCCRHQTICCSRQLASVARLVTLLRWQTAYKERSTLVCCVPFWR